MITILIYHSNLDLSSRISTFFLIYTFFTDSEKTDAAAGNTASKVFLSFFHKTIKILAVQIHDFAAFRTHEMAVFIGSSVKTVCASEI